MDTERDTEEGAENDVGIRKSGFREHKKKRAKGRSRKRGQNREKVCDEREDETMNMMMRMK